MNVDDVLKEQFRELSIIDEYDSDELPNDYDSEDENISKVQSFKLPKRMENYKWEVCIFFFTKEDFK